MKKGHAYLGKYNSRDNGFDSHLLEKYLESQCGKQWNDVYSDICANADPRTIDGSHLREFVGFLVEKSCIIKDGFVYTKDHFPLSRHRPFYVDPETGELRKASFNPSIAKNVEKKVFEMDGKLYHQHDGVWYRVEMEEAVKVNKWFDTIDPSSDQFIRFKFADYHWDNRRFIVEKYGLSPNGLAWYCTKKESASSKEIKRLTGK